MPNKCQLESVHKAPQCAVYTRLREFEDAGFRSIGSLLANYIKPANHTARDWVRKTYRREGFGIGCRAGPGADGLDLLHGYDGRGKRSRDSWNCPLCDTHVAVLFYLVLRLARRKLQETEPFVTSRDLAASTRGGLPVTPPQGPM